MQTDHWDSLFVHLLYDNVYDKQTTMYVNKNMLGYVKNVKGN